MNKIQTKNQSLLLLKKEVEEYVNANQNYFLDFYSALKLFVLISFCTFFYVNVLFVEAYAFMIINSIGLVFSLMSIGFLAHCVTHNSYFSNKKLNSNLGFLWDFFLGVSKESWKYKHNSLHHVYTNINNKDEDIDTGGIFRFSQYQTKYWFHKYQYLYAPFLYSLKYLSMLYIYNVRYFQIKKRSAFEMTTFISGKMLFLFLFLLPLYMQKIEFSIIYIMSMLFFGFYISIVFAPAHFFDKVNMIDEKAEHDFFSSQVNTTSDYATNVIFNELFFGLNYQLEHHLFPQLHYYYYPKINHIVKKHIEKNNLIYHKHETVLDAIISHIKFLKKMGK